MRSAMTGMGIYTGVQYQKTGWSGGNGAFDRYNGRRRTTKNGLEPADREFYLALSPASLSQAAAGIKTGRSTFFFFSSFDRKTFCMRSWY